LSILSTVGANVGLYRYDRGAAIFSSDFIRHKIESHQLLKDAEVNLKDGHYLALADDRLPVFLADRVWTPGLKYDADGFDCDDFAACARADILRAGKRLGFKPSIFVAELCHWPKQGGYHDAILLISATGTLYFYEPQTGKLTKDLASVIRSAGEVWG
jgi:hypothetical protein